MTALSLRARALLALAAAATVPPLVILAVRRLGLEPGPALLVAVLVMLPLIAWLSALWLSPLLRLTRALEGAVLSYRDGDFSLSLAPEAPRELAPDGDAVVEAHVDFQVPSCPECGGVLKPDVVFFGENTERPVVDAAWELFDEGDVLLVLGSSLTVFSGYRFVHRARKVGKSVAIVSLGPTRGDPAATVKVDAPLLPVLEFLGRRL